MGDRRSILSDPYSLALGSRRRPYTKKYFRFHHFVKDIGDKQVRDTAYSVRNGPAERATTSPLAAATVGAGLANTATGIAAALTGNVPFGKHGYASAPTS